MKINNHLRAYIRDDLCIAKDNINALLSEIENDYSYEGYFDEKLTHIEECIKYIRRTFEAEKDNDKND